MEDDSVVKAFLDQLPDPGDMAGREIGPKPDDDVAAAAEVEDQGVELVGHVVLRYIVIPAKAGTSARPAETSCPEVPAFAGMTG